MSTKFTEFKTAALRSEDNKPNDGRRRVPRRPVNRKVGLLVSGKYNICMGYEIGEGGMLIDSVIPLKDKQKVVVNIRIPGALNGVALGSVVYIKQPTNANEPIKYGIQFENVDFDLKRKIRNFVASNTEMDNAV